MSQSEASKVESLRLEIKKDLRVYSSEIKEYFGEAMGALEIKLAYMKEDFTRQISELSKEIRENEIENKALVSELRGEIAILSKDVTSLKIKVPPIAGAVGAIIGAAFSYFFSRFFATE